MSRAIDPDTQDQLDAGAIVERGMILLDLGSGLYGFHNGLGPFVYSGVTYVGAVSLISVEGIRQASGLESVPVVGKLTSMPGSALTPAVLASIEGEVYHQRPVTIFTAYFHPETYALLSVEVIYRGYIDRIVHTETAGGEAVLEVHAESRFRDHQRTGYRVRSDVDQRRINPSDDGLRHVTAVVSERVLFGRAEQPPVQPAKKQKKLLGIF